MLTINTHRFGTLQRSEDDVLLFSRGIFDFEMHRQWLLLGDQSHGGLYWLQNIEQTEFSMPVINPREFVDDYQLVVPPSQLRGLIDRPELLIVLAILREQGTQLCVDLRHPIVVNPQNRLGRQVVSSDQRSHQHVLSNQPSMLSKAA